MTTQGQRRIGRAVLVAMLVLSGARLAAAEDIDAAPVLYQPIPIDIDEALRGFEAEPTHAGEARSGGWIALMAVHGVTVLADIVTSRYAFAHGAVEGNPLYNWAGNDGALVLRAGAGVALTFGAASRYGTHPGRAKGILWSAILLNTAVAIHNVQIVP